jgi:DNA (cytosine-5)-methyltransferase 1
MEVRQIGNVMPNNNRDNPNQGRVYDQNGVCPTLTDMQGGGRQPMIIIGGMQKNQAVKTDGVCTTLTSSMGTGGGYVPMIVDKQIVAMRGRNPDNPSDRTVGSPTEQRLEPNSQGICNTITTVQKDNMVMETGVHRMESRYRIRKLTPNETWRLMDFSDEDFHKADAVCSSTQLYNQAGNSIVSNVLVAIFGQMIPGKEEVYKDVVS